ncbi:ChaC-like protein-domain-containing protein [Dendryphion nanum]|uniref:glutathione-specific gamma-glutamylcyclotransferase n=1 Tax=Dendryphion nanum TaxID=256645 RepID=A0A9P9DSK0_9PLEO|nr:ChaC-like protein-domain-containing protein [Dendryphion nanum]
MASSGEITDAEHQRQIEEFGKDDDFWLFGYGSLIWKPPPHYDQRVPGYIEGYVRRFWQASEDHRGTPSAPGRVVTLISRPHWDTLTDTHATPAEKVWGAAYHIPSSKVAEVREYLDIREINGYSIQFTPFHPAPFTTSISSPPTASDAAANPLEETGFLRGIKAHTTIFSRLDKQNAPINCLVYIGLPENPQFLGPQDPETLAGHILDSRGPSGENREYLYLLERSLLELSKDSGDAHVSDLARRAREIEAGRKAARERERERVGDDEDEDESEEVEGKVEKVGAPLHRIGSTEEQEEVEK